MIDRNTQLTYAHFNAVHNSHPLPLMLCPTNTHQLERKSNSRDYSSTGRARHSAVISVISGQPICNLQQQQQPLVCSSLSLVQSCAVFSCSGHYVCVSDFIAIQLIAFDWRRARREEVKVTLSLAFISSSTSSLRASSSVQSRALSNLLSRPESSWAWAGSVELEPANSCFLHVRPSPASISSHLISLLHSHSHSPS